MSKHLSRVAWAGVVLTGVVALPVGRSAADDTKSPSKDVPTKAPDWSKYAYVKDFTAEVVKADDKKLTVRVKWTALKPPTAKNKPPTTTEQHKDYDYPFVPESLVRFQTLPPKTDDKGKPVAHTQKEKEALKVPMGVTGYLASVDDLKPGTMVQVILVREKTVPADKATEEDLRVKYAIIQPPPPKN